MSNIYPKSPPLWPRARTTVVMPPSRSALFASFYSRRSLVEPLQHLPCALPSHHSIPAALSLIVGASHLDEPLQDLEVTTLGCSPGRSSIPRTALAPRPAQDLQVTFTSSIITNTRAPRAGRVLSPHPLEHLQMTTLGCSTGHFFIPRTALTPRPAQDLQVTFTSSLITNIRVPRAGRVLIPHPLKHLQVTALSSPTTRRCPPRTAHSPQPLDHLKVAAMSSTTTSFFVPQLTELFLWPLAPVLLKHLEVAVFSRDAENSLDDFRIGVVHTELPAPVRAPVLRGGVQTETIAFISPSRFRHELPARPHLRLSQLLGHQSKGAHVVLIELSCDDHPHLRRKLNLFVFLLRSLAPGLELRDLQLQPLDLLARPGA